MSGPWERVMKKEILFLLLVLGIGAWILPCLYGETTSPCESFGVRKLDEKKEAPAFSLKDLNGNQVSLYDYKGKPILLFFWRTTCISCKEDIVLLEKFSQGKRDQFEILTLVIDGEKEKRVKRVVKKYKINLPVLLDAKEKIARTYGIRMIPTAFLINREGCIKGVIVGQRDWNGDTALSAVKEVLNLR